MDNYNERIAAFRLSLSMAESMLRRGIITEQNYAEIRRLLAEKYDISLSSIFLE